MCSGAIRRRVNCVFVPARLGGNIAESSLSHRVTRSPVSHPFIFLRAEAASVYRRQLRVWSASCGVECRGLYAGSQLRLDREQSVSRAVWSVDRYVVSHCIVRQLR